ncbi:UNVERIFIED_CONTAM: hypothetical protein FKN15_057715 [Acipenser sinensis]
MKGWRDGCSDLEELLGRLEDQGWCLACGVYGHTVAVCPFQEEEEEPAQMRKVRRRRQRGGKVRRKQRAARWCTMCIAYGHEDEDCPEQDPEWEEPEHPGPEWEEPERPQPKREEPVRPVSGGEKLKAQTPVFFGRDEGVKLRLHSSTPGDARHQPYPRCRRSRQCHQRETNCCSRLRHQRETSCCPCSRN